MNAPQSVAHRRSRIGFSLLEIIVVIGIIAFLLSITLTAVSSFSHSAREAATATTVLKIQKLMQQRIDGFEAWVNLQKRNQTFDKRIDQKRLELQQIGVYGLKDKTLEILVRKDLLRYYLPQHRFDRPQNDWTKPTTWSRHPVWDALANKHPWNSALHHPSTESSELLYFVLTETEVFGVPPVDSGEFRSAEVADTDNDGLLEFVDAWGNPLRFYRWPTRLFNSDNNIGTEPLRSHANLLFKGLPAAHPLKYWPQDALYRDPDDGLGRIKGDYLRIPAFQNVFTPYNYHSIDTYHAPLVVSAGADGVLGLLEMTADTDAEWKSYISNLGHLVNPSDYDALTDNITNRNRRAGGGQ
ncbi:MAG: type II secretion system protein [Planctomycetota bacterium]|nr:type II secretion system protein [Planctomycetota bacterium]